MESTKKGSSAWVAVDKCYDGEKDSEWMFSERPVRISGSSLGKFWGSSKGDIIKLPIGTIEKIIGRTLTWEDAPVRLTSPVEYAVGDIIQFGKVKLSVEEEEEECVNCFFYDLCDNEDKGTRIRKSMVGECFSAYRKDAKDVIFREIE